MQKRADFSNVLQAHGSSMSAYRYKRLLAMSITLILWGTLLTSFVLGMDIRYGLRPSASWERVHSRWNRANLISWAVLTPRNRLSMLIGWSMIPVSTIISFVFLGFGEEALRGYRKMGSGIMSVISSRVLPKRNTNFGKGILPIPPLPSAGLRSALFTMLQSNPSHTF